MALPYPAPSQPVHLAVTRPAMATTPLAAATVGASGMLSHYRAATAKAASPSRRKERCMVEGLSPIMDGRAYEAYVQQERGHIRWMDR